MYRDNDKGPTILHNRIFQGLQQTGSTDASALSKKYSELAQSCELQSKYGIGEQPTNESRECINFAIRLSRNLEGPFAYGTMKLLDSNISCKKNTNGNDALPTHEDILSSRDAQVVWHETNISKVGRLGISWVLLQVQPRTRSETQLVRKSYSKQVLRALSTPAE